MRTCLSRTLQKSAKLCSAALTPRRWLRARARVHESQNLHRPAPSHLPGEVQLELVLQRDGPCTSHVVQQRH